MSLMALLGIMAFYSYGQNTVYDQKVVEIESIINQLNIVAKNPEKDASGYCLQIDSKKQKISLSKSIDLECRNTVQVREVVLSNDQKFTDNGKNIQDRLIYCGILADSCVIKNNVNDLNATAI
ncbi:MAG: hypothetical protein WCO23_01895, partial [bacterium]